MAEGFKGKTRHHFCNGLDSHGLLLNVIDECNEALDANGLDRPVGRNRQWVSDRRMRKKSDDCRLYFTPPGHAVWEL
jgi:hypothetical protein